MITLLKSVFRYASREYGIKNVIDGIVMPKIPKTEVRLLTEKESRELKTYINRRKTPTGLGIALAMYTGLRIGELCALTWGGY